MPWTEPLFIGLNMVKTIDHYEYFNKNRNLKTKLYDREKISLRLISKVLKEQDTFLDAGCGHGDFLEYIKRVFPQVKLKGLDYSKKEVLEAKKNGFDVSQSDFEEGIKLQKEKYQVVYAGEVLEHLYNTDLFLSELNRITKMHGYLIISTPNLCAWFNRIFMFLGIQPLFVEMSTKSSLVGSGPLKSLKKGNHPVGHIRIFTLAALKDICEMNGFKIIDIKGASYEEGLPRWLLPIDRIFKLFPGLSPQMVVLAKKVRNI